MKYSVLIITLFLHSLSVYAQEKLPHGVQFTNKSPHTVTVFWAQRGIGWNPVTIEPGKTHTQLGGLDHYSDIDFKITHKEGDTEKSYVFSIPQNYSYYVQFDSSKSPMLTPKPIQEIEKMDPKHPFFAYYSQEWNLRPLVTQDKIKYFPGAKIRPYFPGAKKP